MRDSRKLTTYFVKKVQHKILQIFLLLNYQKDKPAHTIIDVDATEAIAEEIHVEDMFDGVFELISEPIELIEYNVKCPQNYMKMGILLMK